MGNAKGELFTVPLFLFLLLARLSDNLARLAMVDLTPAL
jgi:hypothetical protein